MESTPPLPPPALSKPHNISAINTSTAPMNNSAVGLNASMNASSMNASMNASSMNNSLSFLMYSVAQQEEDNAQSILEDHVSRIWDESSGQTPNLTPGRHSPDRVRAAAAAAAAAAAGGIPPTYPPKASSSSSHHKRSGAMQGGKDQHMLSLQSFDSGIVGSDDKQTAVSSAATFVDAVAAAAASGSTDASQQHHKHIHHYHHHHHHIHKDSSSASGNKQLRSASSSADRHMLPGPPLSSYQPSAKDKQRLAAAVAKRIPDNNSNIDSGIYDLPTAMPNLSNPANEKYVDILFHFTIKFCSLLSV